MLGSDPLHPLGRCAPPPPPIDLLRASRATNAPKGEPEVVVVFESTINSSFCMLHRSSESNLTTPDKTNV